MTLRQTLVAFNLRITHPEILADLIIENYAQQCVISMFRYFQSGKFYDDMSEAVLEIQDGIDHGYENFVLSFVNTSDGDLALKVNYLESSYSDSIETYQ